MRLLDWKSDSAENGRGAVGVETGVVTGGAATDTAGGTGVTWEGTGAGGGNGAINIGEL